MFQNIFQSISTVAQNLYAPESSETVKPIVDSVTNTQATKQISSSFDLVMTILSNLNYLLLAWSIFYSVVLYMNFWYWRVYRTADRLHHEAKGVKSIQDAWWIWIHYFQCLVVFTMIVDYKNFTTLLFSIFVYFIVRFIISMSNEYSNPAGVAFEIITFTLVLFTTSSNFTFTRSMLIIVFLATALDKFGRDLTVILESLAQGFSQIGWSNNWPSTISKFLRELYQKPKEVGFLSIILPGIKDKIKEKQTSDEKSQKKAVFNFGFGTLIFAVIIFIILGLIVVVMSFLT